MLQNPPREPEPPDEASCCRIRRVAFFWQVAGITLMIGGALLMMPFVTNVQNINDHEPGGVNPGLEIILIHLPLFIFGVFPAIGGWSLFQIGRRKLRDLTSCQSDGDCRPSHTSSPHNNQFVR